jgi:hypothetical protein
LHTFGLETHQQSRKRLRAVGQATTQSAHHHHLLRLEEQVNELHDVEERGESGWTPLLAIANVWLVLVPVVAVILAAALIAYYWG